MDITSENLKLVFQAVRAKYDEGIGQTKTPLLDALCERMTSVTSEQVYAFLDRFPKFREWLGPRVINNLVEQDMTVKNRKFELTAGIARDRIEDDQVGIYGPKFRRLGEQTQKWRENLIRDRLQAGKTTKTFDGKNFFATDHYQNFGRKTGSQANLFTAKPLTLANYVTVRQAMMAHKGADGEPLDDFGSDVVLVVDPSNENTAKQILQSSIIVATGVAGDAASTNVQQGSASLVVASGLGNEAGTWYLADRSGERPMFFQERTSPDLVTRFNPDDPHVFDLDEFLFGSRARGEAAFNLWWKIARVEPS